MVNFYFGGSHPPFQVLKLQYQFDMYDKDFNTKSIWNVNKYKKKPYTTHYKKKVTKEGKCVPGQYPRQCQGNGTHISCVYVHVGVCVSVANRHVQ